MRQVIAPLLQTLEVVHQQGVIHRDIKPENLFLTEAGVVRLGDWGLAINQLQEKAYSRVGTLDYMAPEVSPLYPVQSFRNAAEIRALAFSMSVGQTCKYESSQILVQTATSVFGKLE